MASAGASKHGKAIAIALVVLLPCLLVYIVGNAGPDQRGGTIAGLFLGMVAVGLLLLLTFYSFRKRNPTWAYGTRQGWMRTHAYVGIAAGIVVLLHSGFHLGGPIAALAGGSYLLVVLSGIYGLVVYGTVPKMMTAETDELSPEELIERIRGVQEEIAKVGEGKSVAFRQVARAESRDVRKKLGLSLLFMTKKRQREQGKAEVIAKVMQQVAPEEREEFRKMFVLIMQKSKFEERLLPKARYLILMHGWLKFHIPLTAVVYAATLVHVASVVYYGIVIP